MSYYSLRDGATLALQWIAYGIQQEGIIRFPTEKDLNRIRTAQTLDADPNLPSDFKNLLAYFLNNNTCPYEIDFTNFGLWYQELNISGITFERELKGWEALQGIQLKISSCKFKEISLSQLEFQKEVDFSNTQFTKVSFVNTVFKDKAVFYEAKLKTCDFSQAEFHKKADFRYAVLTSCTFQFTEFRAQGAFYGVTFINESKFDNLILKDTSHLYFEGLNGWDKKSKDAQKFTLINTVVNGRVDFSEDTIKVLDLRGSPIVGTLTRRDFTPEPANWETAVILKHEEIKRNNVIKALRYKAIEKDLYAKELRAKKKSLQEWGEYLALQMSWLSNNHGQDWLRAFFMTIFVFGLLPFTLFYLPVPYFNLEWFVMAWQTFWSTEFLSYFIEYFNPTKYDLLTEAYLSSDTNTTHGLIKFFGAITFSVGKIFIVYGGVEVVQAFRKYNKNPS